MTRYRFTLFVNGSSSPSARALDAIRVLVEQHLAGRAELTVVDVVDEPHLAEQRKVIATPTLVLEEPSPARRIIGDLGDPARVLWSLGIVPPDREGTAVEHG